MVTEKGLKKDPELGDKLDKAIFPGLQGGPHDNTTAGIAVALLGGSKPEFKEYGSQIVKNAQALAATLMKRGLKLVTNGTENHLILIDLTPFGNGKGVFAQEALDLAGIVVNKNTIPKEPSSPFYPSGVRLGTPAITTRGMKEQEMDEIGNIMADVINEVKDYDMSNDKAVRMATIKNFRKEISANEVIKAARAKTLEMCRKFPLYPGLE